MKNIIDRVRRRLAYMSHKDIIKVEHQKIVSFTFDDAYESAFKNAGSILDKYKSRGTFYISMSLMKKMIFSKKSLKSAIESGHEIGGHTYAHFSSHSVKKDEMIRDEDRNRNELEKVGVSVENFAYPYGDQTRMVKKYMGERYHSCRGITAGINRDRVDLNNLKAIKLYEKKYSISDIEETLKDFDKRGGWLIFYTHDVEKNYSDEGCSPEYFEEVLRRTLDLGLPIKTVKEALDGIKSKTIK